MHLDVESEIAEVERVGRVLFLGEVSDPGGHVELARDVFEPQCGIDDRVRGLREQRVVRRIEIDAA